MVHLHDAFSQWGKRTTDSVTGDGRGGGGLCAFPACLVVIAATLGRGSYGKVCLSVIPETNQLVAVKVIAKARLKTKAHVRSLVVVVHVSFLKRHLCCLVSDGFGGH